MVLHGQPFLFKWEEVDARSDLDRLHLVAEALPDEGLVRRLEAARGGEAYRGEKDGKPYEQVTKWFGYTVHRVVYATHELPLA